jgi:ABC-type uncharacterized transport system fused permease/ATPase subunit
MDLFDTLTWAKILVKTTFLGTPTLTVLYSIQTLKWFLGRFYSELLHSKIHENWMVFFFLWVFCTSLPNQVEHTWLKSQLYIKYKWVRILFVDERLDSKLQYYGTCKISSKNIKTSHSNHSSHIKDDIM